MTFEYQLKHQFELGHYGHTYCFCRPLIFDSDKTDLESALGWMVSNQKDRHQNQVRKFNSELND